MKKIHNFFQLLTSQLILIFSIILSFITIIITIVGFISSSTVANNTLLYWLPLTFTTILVAITSYLIGSFVERRKEKDADIKSNISKEYLASTDTIAYPPPPPDDFVILRKEIVYEYTSGNMMIFQRKHLKICALKDGINSFRDRYRWTGSGRISIRSLTPGYNTTNPSEDDEGIWNYFNVIFPHPLRKDEVADFTIEWELFDEKAKAITFLSTMIDYETQYLLLEVILPPELAPKKAYFYEYKNFLDTLPISVHNLSWSPATRSIRSEVVQPQKYHKYMIRWYNDEVT
jgi:hypothetical protein